MFELFEVACSVCTLTGLSPLIVFSSSGSSYTLGQCVCLWQIATISVCFMETSQQHMNMHEFIFQVLKQVMTCTGVQ